MKSVEFFYFYLMPETPADSGLAIAHMHAARSGSGSGSTWAGEEADTKGTEEKQALLGRHLGNVADLVEDLRESAVFGGMGR